MGRVSAPCAAVSSSCGRITRVIADVDAPCPAVDADPRPMRDLPPSPLVLTKLAPPRIRDEYLDRPELCVRLARGRQRLTLLNAPAGYGKTTLLAQWQQADDRRPFAWISLDEGDGDPRRFWAYVGESLSQLGTRPAGLRAIGTILINAVAALQRPVVLVLEDYHRLGDSPVHEQLAVLLERGPPNLSVVAVHPDGPPVPARTPACEPRAHRAHRARPPLQRRRSRRDAQRPARTRSERRGHRATAGTHGGLARGALPRRPRARGEPRSRSRARSLHRWSPARHGLLRHGGPGRPVRRRARAAAPRRGPLGGERPASRPHAPDHGIGSTAAEPGTDEPPDPAPRGRGRVVSLPRRLRRSAAAACSSTRSPTSSPSSTTARAPGTPRTGSPRVRSSTPSPRAGPTPPPT